MMSYAKELWCHMKYANKINKKIEENVLFSYNYISRDIYIKCGRGGIYIASK